MTDEFYRSLSVLYPVLLLSSSICAHKYYHRTRAHKHYHRPIASYTWSVTLGIIYLFRVVNWRWFDWVSPDTSSIENQVANNIGHVRARSNVCYSVPVDVHYYRNIAFPYSMLLLNLWTPPNQQNKILGNVEWERRNVQLWILAFWHSVQAQDEKKKSHEQKILMAYLSGISGTKPMENWHVYASRNWHSVPAKS